MSTTQQRNYLKADQQDAHIMHVLARTLGAIHPAKRMMLLSGLAAFNRNVTGD